MANRNVIFNPREIIAACEKAKAEGGDRPLAKVFSIEESARPGPNGTKYMGLHAKVPGKAGRLMVRFTKEKHVGQIAPLDEAEVARINAERGDKYGSLKKRDRHPTMNFQKYKAKIEVDDSGRPKGDLPGVDQQSEYFRVVELVDEFFYEEMDARLKDGRIILRDARRKEYPAEAVVVPSTKIVPMIQTHVSMESKKNPGMELVNPLCRTNMKFDKDTNMAKKAQFFDFTKSHKDPKTGKPTFEPLTFDGHPVTGHNVHLIPSHSTVSGIANLNAVCASNMGLSVPTEVEVLIVEPPVHIGVSVTDVFEDDDGFDFDDNEADKKNVEHDLKANPAPAAVPETAAVAEDDLAGVLSDLGVDDS